MIKKIKSWFFEKISKIDKPLARLTKKENLQITNIRNERKDLTRESPWTLKYNQGIL